MGEYRPGQLGNYELLGKENKSLLDTVRQSSPNAHGADLAALALAHLNPDWQPPVGPALPFFESWLRKNGGEMPRNPKSDSKSAGFIIIDGPPSYARGCPETGQNDDEVGEDAEMEDLQWIGIAVGVAVTALGGGLLWRSWVAGGTKPSSSPLARNPITAPPVSKMPPRKIGFAVAVFSRTIHDRGSDCNVAGDLLTDAAYWWVGQSENWEDMHKKAGLTRIDTVPETDDALIFEVYESLLPPAESIPSSRPEGAMCLREASKGGHLKTIGKFAVTDPEMLIGVGFKKT